MAYNEETDKRVGNIVSGWKSISKKKMFGGVCYMLNGNMFCGIYKDSIILRLGEKGAEEALRSDDVRPFDITGRPMKGWVMVSPDGFADDELLKEWLREAKDFVKKLVPK